MTPSSSQDGDGIPDRTLAHLEWPRLTAALLSRCRGASTRRIGLRFSESPEATRAALAETREAMALLDSGEPLPLDDLRDVHAHLDRVERAGTLDGVAVADLRVTLQHAKHLRRFLASHKTSLSALRQATSFDPSLDQLEATLGDAVGTDGTVLDSASPKLAEVRTELLALRERIIGRLQDVIDRHGDLLSDRYYTLRDGRYVLPVRSDAHDRLPGIVHGSSSSGASIFVEPRAVVAQCNRLKMAEGEREREELRILTALSDLLRERVPVLRAAAQSIDRLDLRSAAAVLGRDFRGVVPDLSEQPGARLLAARHPLLALDGGAVVPNDIEVEAGHGLVISGPNAGGKTVVLKTLGLCTLMLRCGLPLPVGEGSALGHFDSILTELGDDQSTATNLSTFSAHVRNLARILAAANERSLVLLDEVATGTDPGQGAALACAVVDALCKQGAALVVTTHYEALKAFALQDARLRSASVGLDTERMEPTFQLLLGVPGASSALLVARRFGLPAHVVDAAERFLPQQSRDFELLVQELSRAATKLRNEEHALAAERAALAAERRDYDARAAQLREQSKLKLTKEADKLMQELRQARDELEKTRKSLRQAPAPDLAAAQKELREIATRVAAGSEIAAAIATEPTAGVPTAPATDLQLGARVYVPRLRAEGAIVEAPSKGRVLVAVGAMKLWVDVEELRASFEHKTSDTRAPVRTAVVRERDDVRAGDNTLDLRGLRADDALSLLESFIDRLYASPAKVGYVLHGHGTGALRNLVREHLRDALPYVSESRPGTSEEGGDAVTTFYLSH